MNLLRQEWRKGLWMTDAFLGNIRSVRFEVFKLMQAASDQG
jgi:hypothetical protein